MSNQSNPPDPFNPTLRRIGPADLPKEATTAPADRTSKIPAGVSDSSPKPRPASCPRCQDSGYYTLPVAYGHPDFCKLQSCNCAAYQQQLAPRAARLGDELGSLADKTFDRFDLTRPIVPTVWQGAAMSEVAQRNFLRAAHKRCQAWSAAPRGWLFLHGAFGAGKSHLAAAIANDSRWHRRKIVRFVTVE
jgi:DNA replication protein DnaC